MVQVIQIHFGKSAEIINWKQRSKIYVVSNFIHACSTQYTFEFEIQRIKYHGNCKLSEDGTCIKLKQDRAF